MLQVYKTLQNFATTPFLKLPIKLKPPMALKPPVPLKKVIPPAPSPMSPTAIASRLNISQSSLRKQMINPKANLLSEQQLEMINIINDTQLNVAEVTNSKYEQKKKSPVITIMGHVDHGKTTLIDYLRHSTIAQKQHGGITQKIGAFHIECHGQKITFIDTPGHEAFTNMRQRGAKMTDLVVLIVSATQGVKKQTIQIIKIITQNQIPCIVAINKLDLPNADPQTCEKSLHQAGLQIEPFGGSIQVVHISAKTGQNVSLLSELILQETKSLTAIHDGTVQGMILQANKNHQGHNSVTMIIQKGTLKQGSILIIGDTYVKVKDMKDDRGNSLNVGVPGNAVEIVGISQVPKAGQLVYEVKDQKKAKFILNKKKEKEQVTANIDNKQSTLTSTKIKIKNRRQRRAFCRGFSQRWLQKYRQAQEKILLQIQNLKLVPLTDEIQMSIMQKQEELNMHRKYVQQYLMNTKDKPNTLNLILKFSNRGIQQTILEQLESVAAKIKSSYEINLNILSNEIGEVTLSDVKNSKLSNAEIVTFGVGITMEASQRIMENGVNVRFHELIHSFLGCFQEIAVKRKRSSIKGIERGFGEIMEIYSLKKGKKGNIIAAGLKVQSGKLQKKNKFYIFRGGVPITQPLFADFIKVFKNDQMEVKKGQQCTISFNNGQAGLYQKGDEIYCFEQ